MQKSGAERLAEYRDKFDYKQREIAELLEIDDAYVSQLLSGKRRPGLELAVRIEARTGIPAESWLLTGIGRSKRAKDSDADLDEIHSGQSDAPRS
jgi:transcriptional regulator with XRE-family HTH domain